MQIQLPKLQRINSGPKKKKILLISDSIVYASGVATAAKEVVIGTAHRYDWVQLGAALQHPDHGKIIDLSEEINREAGITDAYCKIYCHTGYGNADVIREIISYENPDAILLVTDPRFFGHVFLMEHELRVEFKIPVMYWNIWDNFPAPFWNASAYSSCDLLMAINRQTKVINRMVLDHHGTKTSDIDNTTDVTGTLLSYVPHGSSVKYFYKQTPESPDWEAYCTFKNNFKEKHGSEFVIFYNSRNIRRKQPGDILLSYARFCDGLTPEQAKKCCLIMKTAIQDENGTDLLAVKRAICPDYKVLFIEEMISAQHLNYFYNLADCTFFMSSAEGFGLAANESLMCGTMIIAPATGGLQDQMRFENDNGEWVEFDDNFTSNHRGRHINHGEWAYALFPRARALQGSIPTPYIFDDYCDAEDAAIGLRYIHDLSPEERVACGQAGRDWVMSEESGMSSVHLVKRFIKSVDTCIDNFKPKPKAEIIKVAERKKITNNGITW